MQGLLVAPAHHLVNGEEIGGQRAVMQEPGELEGRGRRRAKNVRARPLTDIRVVFALATGRRS